MKIITIIKNKLANETGCTIQHTGYPCNSCFHNMDLALKEDIHEYWLAVLHSRGDYNGYDWKDADVSNFPKLLIELNNSI
jgi:hypothetical protein